MSGKTTTLRYLFKKFSNEENLTSIETTTGRTLFFDFGILSMKGGDWLIKIALYSATGQDFYAATRPATLTGADGIIFIIDSRKNVINDNLNSWIELKSFYGKTINEIPLVLCLNKQDLDDLSNQETIIEKFKVDDLSKVKVIATEAITGKGVIKTFKFMMGLLFPTIKIS